MVYKVIIREISEQVIEIEAESAAIALEQVETDYWKSPNDYYPESCETEFIVK